MIIDPAFVGDVVFDAPLVRWLRERRPKAHLAMVVRPPADGVARCIAGIDAVHVYDKRGADRGIKGLHRVARVLSDARYDVALIPHPSVRSVLLASVARIRCRVGIGQAWLARRGLTTSLAPAAGDTFVGDRLRLGVWLLGEGAHESDTSAAETAGIAGSLSVPRDRCAHRLRDAAAEVAAETAAEVAAETAANLSSFRRRPLRGACVGLVLGSNWATKRWPVDHAGTLIRQLHEAGASIMLLGSEAERPLVEAMEAVRPGTREIVIDGMGGTLDALIDRVAECDLLVAGDTGPLHIARGLGVPVVALFGPTPETRHRFSPHDVVLTNSLDCRPCSRHGDARCPLGHHRCLRDLSSSRVFAAVRETLEQRARRSSGLEAE
ncbi:MAG: glycosyltransferase family 9 protein [Deltaproteobacteria bacterium]|nr:glycosyltransferase family 9 protein [Deltaproteobacteria bacterium]